MNQRTLIDRYRAWTPQRKGSRRHFQCLACRTDAKKPQLRPSNRKSFEELLNLVRCIPEPVAIFIKPDVVAPVISFCSNRKILGLRDAAGNLHLDTVCNKGIFRKHGAIDRRLESDADIIGGYKIVADDTGGFSCLRRFIQENSAGIVRDPIVFGEDIVSCLYKKSNAAHAARAGDLISTQREPAAVHDR